MDTRIWILGNWKMHGKQENLADIQSLKDAMATRPLPSRVSVGLFLPATLLVSAGAMLEGEERTLLLGGQNCHQEEAGAFTGSIAPSMLVDASASMVLLGHSECRAWESSSLIASKVARALEARLRVVLCVGEPLSVKEKGETIAFLLKQLEESVPKGCSFDAPDRLLIAYEPIWSIGTGSLPSVESIAHILETLKEQMRVLIKSDVPVLYGGSVNKDNVASMLSYPSVNGVLVGGASLQWQSFWEMITRGTEGAC